jgi:predicted amino acid-binding ACT domain protein
MSSLFPTPPRFSSSVLPQCVKLYMCTVEIFAKLKTILKDEIMMSRTVVGDEVTLFVYYDISDDKNNNNFIHTVLENHVTSFDSKIYHIISIYEDIPGIDHVGIIADISTLFSKKGIPILYLNTYSNNLIIISEEWLEESLSILKDISTIS